MQDDRDRPPREMPWDRDRKINIPILTVAMAMLVIALAMLAVFFVSTMTSPRVGCC